VEWMGHGASGLIEGGRVEILVSHPIRIERG
jgi:hypothetical protein